jgi:hypothetical protein
MKRKIIPLGTALIISVIFLSLVLAPEGCAFNLLPYEIDEGLSNGAKGDNEFIETFDVIVAIIIFFLVYKALRKVLFKKPK